MYGTRENWQLLGAVACSRPKFWVELRSLAAITQSGRGNAVEFRVNFDRIRVVLAHATLTHRLEPNDRSRFIFSTSQWTFCAVTLTFAWTTRLTSTFGRGILFARFCRRSWPKVKDGFWIELFGRALAQFSRVRYRNGFRSRILLNHEHLSRQMHL